MSNCGKVLWFSRKGFGALVDKNGKDTFVHYSGIKTNYKRRVNLEKDEEVKFDVVEDEKSGKQSAVNVVSAHPSGKFSFERVVTKRRKKKNTESFEPSHEPCDLRVVCPDGSKETYNGTLYSNEVLLVNNMFEDSENMYDSLLKEMKECGVEDENLWKLWHGDTHFIADDKKGWKKKCPVFNSVIERIAKYFNMDIKATRFNWYKDSKQWKPYHHDAAAVKKDKAKTQNFTVGVSFGATREASFQHAKHRTTVNFPLVNGSAYTFAKDVNIEWRHGIPQRSVGEMHSPRGRISIIAWGKVEMDGKL